MVHNIAILQYMLAHLTQYVYHPIASSENQSLDTLQ